MNIPEDRLYAKTHEWVKKTGEGTAQVGISDYAQGELGDVVFVNLPAPGDAVTAGASFADVESVKAVSDVYSPVSGTVTVANEALLDDAALLNADCYAAWMIEVENADLPADLMDAAAYSAFLETL